jgi:hypothetical protein
MKPAIYHALKGTRSRQQWLFALRCTAVGLAVSTIAGVALGTGRLAFGFEVSTGLRVAVMAVGPLAGFLVGLLVRRTWHDAAIAIDSHYELKDRTITALAFADRGGLTDLHSMQITDALSRLDAIEPKAVAPLAIRRSWLASLVAAIAAVVLLAWPLATPEVGASPAPVPDQIKAVALEQKEKLASLEKKLPETAQDLDDDKADDDKRSVKDLVQKLLEKIEELTEPGTDEMEALAKLSEMQAAVQALANELNIAALDGQLSSLGTALAASTAFEGAGKALQEGKLEKAAKELERIDEVKLTPKEAKALEEKLKQLAKKMGEAGQGSLGDNVGELADNLKGGKGKVGKATGKLAKKINNAVKRRKVNDLLLAELEDLKESKCNCQCNGGPRLRMPQKSDSPSSTWGRGISGNISGEKTKLASTRTDQQITGTPGGEGESEVETTATPEARQQASREYQEKYQKFKKESEAVLEGEPIPLGHRQTVKKYFELIRPSNTDTTKTEGAAPKSSK